MNDFVSKQKIKLLEIISESGHYKNRKYIAESIDSFSNQNQNKLRLMKILLNDKIEIISKLIINESTKMNLTKAQQNEFDEKIEYWNQKEFENNLKKEKMKKIFKNTTNRKRKFSNGETFQNMKEIIKKPMNIGKWM
jgi:hypothetical protein